MDITEEEHGWALAIKEALLKEDEALGKRITDFEYAHHAIIAKEKVDKAVRQHHNHRAFKALNIEGEQTNRHDRHVRDR